MLLPSLILTLAPALASDLEADIASAGEDVGRLWTLVEQYRTAEDDDGLQRAARRILEVDADHEGARTALGHHRYDERWFETYTELSAYRREEDRRMLEEHGMVRFRETWVASTDIPFVRMGWSQAEDGRWMSPAAHEDARRAAELTAEGWQQQDLTWIHPDDFDKWRDGLWKCGDEWLTVEEADAWHAELDRGWKIPAEHFVAQGTVNRESLRWAGWWADQTYADLVRIFGQQPESPPTVVVLRTLDQYNRFAAGDPAGARPPTEADGYSSVHYAYFAESWFDPVRREHLGCGVAYWDTADEALAPFGQHAIRHAAAHSFVEAIDPSWNAISQTLEAPGRTLATAAFWQEKRIPRWLRYGAASYVERYFHDPNVGDDGSPWWARDWALSNLRQQGGLRDLASVFAFTLAPNDPAGSGQRIHEAGLLVSFVLDGGCTPVIEKHQAFRAALRGKGDTAAAAQALQDALVANEAALRAYANL